ncbi:cell division protein FtsZ [Rhodopila sp.]|uniref:cell division protein FtsZ n=1 Tax=Rhodopila sp. TaxID=2480087 RepID=UPI003D0BD1F3
MTLNLMIPTMTHTDFSPRITVIGVGGGGTNAVDNMIAANLQGVEFVVANTDAQQLMHSRADRRIQLGPHITQGLGAGAKPEIGKAAAEEAADELYRHLDGAHMVFITAGMGGGTGTGAAPVIAKMARERNILTVGVVTKPFGFEGVRRARSADQGIEELQQYVDTLIVIPNQNLFRIANERTTWREAFKMADQVLYMGVRGVTDLMMVHGLVNLDFADIRTVMAEMGKAMMGTGEAEGENRAIRAAEAAINNPLLEDTSMAGARGLLINITGGEDLALFEVDQAANRIREEVDEEANVIFGSAVDESLAGQIRVSVVATGIDSHKSAEQLRPKLFAVGGAAPAPQPIINRNGAPALVPGAAQNGLAAPLRQISQQQSEAVANAASMMDAQPSQPGLHQPGPHQPGLHQPAYPPNPVQQRPAQPQPIVQLNSRANLFAAQPQGPAAVPAPVSLFNKMTGVLRGRTFPPTVATTPQPITRREPEFIDDQPQTNHVSVRQTSAGEETGIEIPAFLRRQLS